MRMNINVEELAHEDPLKILDGKETVVWANGKYSDLFGKTIREYLSQNNFKKIGGGTSKDGFSEMYSREGSFIYCETRLTGEKNENENRIELKVDADSLDNILDITKYMIEKFNPNINKYIKINN